MSDLLVHLVGAICFVAVFLIVTQDLQIFPGALFSVFRGRTRRAKSLPYGVESQFIDTADGCRLELWRLPAEDPRAYIAIVFHGNAGSLENFFLMQLWFQEQGITSYGFDYRGFGHSSGWPNERGIERDSDAVWSYVLAREKIDPSRIIICGFSVGGAPAARIASLHKPKLLVLVSAFTSIPAVISEHPLLRPLARFSWNQLSTETYLSQLSESSLILMHGAVDTIIAPHHSDRLAARYCGTGEVRCLLIAGAGHNDVFFAGRHALAGEMGQLLR